MQDLDSLLANPDVELVESTGEFGPAEIERVREGRNRAAAGIVRDDDRVLLMRREGDWRLPGTDVGRVVDFEQRLREALCDRIGIQSATLVPTRIHRHTAENAEDVPAYHYVLYEVDPAEPSPSSIADAPAEDVELGWFADRPSDVANPGVMDRVFGDEG